MIRSRLLAAVAATGALTLAALLVASPAQAATIASGQRITIASNYYGAPGLVFDASPVDATLTQLPEGFTLAEGEFVSGIDVNDDGQGYAIITSQPDGWGESFILPFDATTGAVGPRVEIVNVSEGIDGFGCQGLDLSTDGRWYTSCKDAGVLFFVGWVDPTTGEYTVLESYFQNFLVTEFATDPTTGTIWAFTAAFDGSSFSLNTMNPENGSLYTTHSLTKPVWGADFDRDGTLFVTSFLNDVVDNDYAELNTLSVEDGTVTVIDVVTDDGVALEDDREPLTVWGHVPAPVLPVTGAGDAVPVGLGAALLLLLGAAFVVMRRSVIR